MQKSTSIAYVPANEFTFTPFNEFSMSRNLSVLLAVCLACMSHASRADSPWQADEALVAKLSQSRSEFNYVESLVPKYTLPDPLRLASGSIVTEASQWPARREETMELFRSYVYGRRPTADYQVTFEVIEERKDLFGLGAVGRSVIVDIAIESEHYQFPLLVFLPSKNAKETNGANAMPAVVHINNQEFPDFEKAIAVETPFWPIATLLKRGYVTAAVSTMAIDPDRADGFAEGVRGAFARAAGQPDQKSQPEDAWKSLSAWGWGASRALDYLMTMDEVDHSKVAVIGHSRGGKAAVWAAAEDPRFWIACSNNSGCGGAALSRRAYGETVARITTSFPHWFCNRFANYAGKESELPVDQHQILGLIAPRPIYVTSASADLWADPRGEYLSLVGAAPVYKLFGKSVIEQVEMPAIGQPRREGSMGYHIRSGEHGLTAYDWEKFLDFCDSQLQRR